MRYTTPSRVEELPRHRFESHTADVRLHVEAADLASLFEEAARALAELVGGANLAPAAEEAPLTVAIHAPDREALLVEWLNELVFRSETERKVFPVVRVIDVNDSSVRAEVFGVGVTDLDTPVKAATWHGVLIWQTPYGWEADVVLDV